MRLASYMRFLFGRLLFPEEKKLNLFADYVVRQWFDILLYLCFTSVLPNEFSFLRPLASTIIKGLSDIIIGPELPKSSGTISVQMRCRSFLLPILTQPGQSYLSNGVDKFPLSLVFLSNTCKSGDQLDLIFWAPTEAMSRSHLNLNLKLSSRDSTFSSFELHNFSGQKH